MSTVDSADERPRDVPAGAQRTRRALQEPLRRDAGQGAARARSRWPSAAPPPAATSTPPSSTSKRAARTRPPTSPIPRTTLAGLLAIDQFVELLPSLAESARDRAGRPRPHRRRPASLAAQGSWSPRTRCRATSRRTTSWSRRSASTRPSASAAASWSSPVTRSPSGWPARRSAPGTSRWRCPPSTTSGSSPRTPSPTRRRRRSRSAPGSATSWRRRSPGRTSSCCRATCWNSRRR